MSDNLTDTGKFTAVQESIKEARNFLASLILGVQDANNAGKAADAATRKAKTEELKKKLPNTYRPE